MSLRAQSLKDIFTFTRASTATYFNSAGVLTTAGVDEPRIDYDPATLACRGLLIEDSRTNLILNSATFATQNVTVTNVPHTLSFYGTGTIALTGVASPEVSLVGTGANDRVSLTFTVRSASPSTLTLTLTGSATKAQLEVGDNATSYIPTTTVAVTRAADYCYTSTLAPWFNEEEGTLFAEYVVPWSYSSGMYVAQIDDGSSDNRHSISHSDAKPSAYTVAEGVAQVSAVSASPIIANTATRVAYAWAADDVAFASTGRATVTDSSATMPTDLATFRLGGADSVGYGVNGYIRKVKFWPRRLSDSELAALVA